MVLAIVLGACASPPDGSPEAWDMMHTLAYAPGAWPITSAFRDHQDSRGMRRRSLHTGVDILAPAGTPVLAAAAGRVRVERFEGAGNVVFLEVAGAREPTLLEYAHLQRVLVDTGDTVRRGQPLGEVGSTGRESGGVAHLHFGVQRDARSMVDPVPWLFGDAGMECAGRPAGAGGPRLLYPLPCTRP